MTILFWICWLLDLLLCAVAIIGKGFADSFHPSSPVPWLTILLIGCTIGGASVFFQKNHGGGSWMLDDERGCDGAPLSPR